MLSSLRPALGKVLRPVARALVAVGVTADVVTVIGMLGASSAALFFFPRGDLFWGPLVVTAFTLFDMLDGAVARERASSSTWGAFLDSCLDRVTDVAVFGGLLWWFATGGEAPRLAALCLFCLGAALVISYVKARAEGLGMTCDVGIAERAVRLIVILLGTFLTGVGVPYAVNAALWLLAVATAVTVGQRFVTVYRQALERV